MFKNAFKFTKNCVKFMKKIVGRVETLKRRILALTLALFHFSNDNHVSQICLDKIGFFGTFHHESREFVTKQLFNFICLYDCN